MTLYFFSQRIYLIEGSFGNTGGDYKTRLNLPYQGRQGKKYLFKTCPLALTPFSALCCVAEQITVLEKAINPRHPASRLSAVTHGAGIGQILALTIMLEVGEMKGKGFVSNCEGEASEEISEVKTTGDVRPFDRSLLTGDPQRIIPMLMGKLGFKGDW